MALPCTICIHDQRLSIEWETLSGVPLARVGQRYAVSPHALWRHKERHLPANIVAAHRAAVAASNQALVGQLQALTDNLVAQMREAHAQGDYTGALRCVEGARRTLGVMARLQGLLK